MSSHSFSRAFQCSLFSHVCSILLMVSHELSTTVFLAMFPQTFCSCLVMVSLGISNALCLDMFALFSFWNYSHFPILAYISWLFWYTAAELKHNHCVTHIWQCAWYTSTKLWPQLHTDFISFTLDNVQHSRQVFPNLGIIADSKTKTHEVYILHSHSSDTDYWAVSTNNYHMEENI